MSSSKLQWPPEPTTRQPTFEPPGASKKVPPPAPIRQESLTRPFSSPPLARAVVATAELTEVIPPPPTRNAPKKAPPPAPTRPKTSTTSELPVTETPDAEAAAKQPETTIAHNIGLTDAGVLAKRAAEREAEEDEFERLVQEHGMLGSLGFAPLQDDHCATAPSTSPPKETDGQSAISGEATQSVDRISLSPEQLSTPKRKPPVVLPKRRSSTDNTSSTCTEAAPAIAPSSSVFARNAASPSPQGQRTWPPSPRSAEPKCAPVPRGMSPKPAPSPEPAHGITPTSKSTPTRPVAPAARRPADKPSLPAVHRLGSKLAGDSATGGTPLKSSPPIHRRAASTLDTDTTALVTNNSNLISPPIPRRTTSKVSTAATINSAGMARPTAQRSPRCSRRLPAPQLEQSSSVSSTDTDGQPAPAFAAATLAALDATTLHVITTAWDPSWQLKEKFGLYAIEQLHQGSAGATAGQNDVPVRLGDILLVADGTNVMQIDADALSVLLRPGGTVSLVLARRTLGSSAASISSKAASGCHGKEVVADQEKLEAATLQQQAMAAELQTSSAAREADKRTLAAQDVDLNAVRAQLQTQNEALAEARRQADVLTAQLLEAASQVRALEKANELLAEQLADQSTRQQHADKQAAAEILRLQTALNEQDRRVSELLTAQEQASTSKDERSEALQAQLETLETSMAALVRRLEEEEKTRTVLQATVADKDTQLAHQRDNVKSVQTRLDQLLLQQRATQLGAPDTHLAKGNAELVPADTSLKTRAGGEGYAMAEPTRPGPGPANSPAVSKVIPMTAPAPAKKPAAPSTIKPSAGTDPLSPPAGTIEEGRSVCNDLEALFGGDGGVPRLRAHGLGGGVSRSTRMARSVSPSQDRLAPLNVGTEGGLLLIASHF